MELQKTRKAFGSPSTPGQKKIHYSEPSKQFFYSESRLLMDYPFEKMIGGIVALGVFFLSWLVQVWNYKRLEKLLAHQVHLAKKKSLFRTLQTILLFRI